MIFEEIYNGKLYKVTFVECKTSFTFRQGEISTLGDQIFKKGEIYKLIIEEPWSQFCWIKVDSTIPSTGYGAGTRFLYRESGVKNINDGHFKVYPNYTDYFLTPLQTLRNKKLNELLY